MVKNIVGGVITLVIGGTVFTISQSDVAKNLSNNTGMSQQQAQQYVNNIPQSDLSSFDKIGTQLVSDGNSIQDTSIDCDNYTYQWESATLSCSDGKAQIQKMGTDEINLGNCYQALGSNLGDAAKPKISECVAGIDTVNADYALPIASILPQNTITDEKNTNSYNKSVLQAALGSN